LAKFKSEPKRLSFILFNKPLIVKSKKTEEEKSKNVKKKREKRRVTIHEPKEYSKIRMKMI